MIGIVFAITFCRKSTETELNMNTIKGIVGLVAIGSLIALAVNAADYSPCMARATAVAPYMPSMVQDAPVAVATQASYPTYTVPVSIIARRPARAVHQVAACGAFQYRAVTQGPVAGQVRGFCL